MKNKWKVLLGITLPFMMLLLVAWVPGPWGAREKFRDWLRTNALTITVPWTFDKIKLPLDNDATEPTLCFDGGGGDCDTGFHETADDIIRLAFAGSDAWVITANTLGSNNSSGGGLQNETAAAINSTLLPNRTNVDTGVGSAADGQVSLIGDDQEILRADGTVTSGASVWTGGGIVVGDVSGATVSPITGSTAYVLIISGVSPVGGSGGSPVDSIQLYATGNELFVADGNGTHTGLGSFDLVSGQATSKKWNVYTGKIVTRNWETGVVTMDSGTTIDWVAVQIAHQKKVFINSYTQQPIEVPQGQATKFGDIEIEDKLWWTVKYRFERGKKREYNDYAKKLVKSKIKTIRLDHWMDEDGKFWRKRTRDEAIVAYVIDMGPICTKYENSAPFLKAEINNPCS